MINIIFKPILQKKILVSSRLCVSIIILFTALTACQNKASGPKTATVSTSTTTNKIQTVGIIHATTRSFTAETEITGTARPNQKVMLYAMESGYVKSIRKDIGDKVNKGEVIATLANPLISKLVADAQGATKIAAANLSTIETALIAAEADAKAKQSIFDRLNRIAQKTPQLTTLMDVENAEAAAKIAQAEIATKQAEIQAAQNKIEAYQQQLTITQQQANSLSIKAPFSGTITRRLVDKGAMVQSGLTETNPMGIVEIQETNLIRLTIPMPESDASAIKKGMEVTVNFPELPGESFTTKISRTAGALDPVSKTMQVEIDVPNSDGKILTGMYAKVNMNLGSRNDVLALPIIAKVLYKDAPHILVVKDGIVDRVPLRIGLTGKDYFEVLNSEITKATQVIVQGKSLVKVGQKVEAKTVGSTL